MVSNKQVKAANALINDATGPQVAVFAGGTSGTGKYTVEALVRTGASVRIYLVGRKSSEERMRGFIQELHQVNPKAEVIWTEGEISLLSETKRVCEFIKSRESRVDLLFLSAGYAPFTRHVTSEGLEVAQVLEYHGRMLFTLQLLPLLRKSEAPRVVSVLAGWFVNANIELDDISLRKPENFGAVKAQTQYGSMNSTTLDKLATENPDVAFIHSWPGLVDTGNVNRGSDPNSILGWVRRILLAPIFYLFSASDVVSGQRHLFQSTSAAFGGRGVPWQGDQARTWEGNLSGGLFLLNNFCNWSKSTKAMTSLRENAQARVWAHTQEVLGPYL